MGRGVRTGVASHERWFEQGADSLPAAGLLVVPGPAASSASFSAQGKEQQPQANRQ